MRYPYGGRQCKRLLPVNPRTANGGFTYIGLLLIVTLMGIALLAVGEVWHVARKREKEQALLYVGNQFRQAIKSYAAHTPGANKQQSYPSQLEDLLKDPRFPSTQRYLRKIYIDPVSGSSEWGVLRMPGGGIYGVYSLSEESPIKRGNFRLGEAGFEGKDKYSDWKFVYLKSQIQK